MPRLSGGTDTPDLPSATTSPAIAIAPSSGDSKPAISRISTVLPHPDGPSSVKHSPSAISKESAEWTWWAP